MTDRPSVLQVHIDEPGGGQAHLKHLKEALASSVRWNLLSLDRRLVRGGSIWRPRLRRRIDDAIKNSRPDIVHCHGIRAAIAVTLARPPVPLAVTLHGLHAVRRSRALRRSIESLVASFTLKRADLVLCLGTSDFASVKHWRLGGSTDVRWIHTAFTRPLERDRTEARRAFDLPEDGKLILWMGRFDEEKSPHLFIEAAAQVIEKKGVRVLMAGTGALYAGCARLVRDRGLASRIRMPGWCSDPSIAYSAADVFVSTSQWEGFPLTALEAAWAGLPLVVTDVPGNRDLVEIGLAPVLVRPPNPDALAAGMTTALERERADLSQARAVLSSFSIETLGRDVLSAYQDLLRPSPRRRKKEVRY